MLLPQSRQLLYRFKNCLYEVGVVGEGGGSTPDFEIENVNQQL